jgi:hypothetical protein
MKTFSLSQHISGALQAFASSISPKKTASARITVCDLGRTRTVLLDLEKRADHLFIHHIDIIKNPP